MLKHLKKSFKENKTSYFFPVSTESAISSPLSFVLPCQLLD